MNRIYLDHSATTPLDPLVIDRVKHAVRSTSLGPVLKPAWSVVSITEVSEYVPTEEQYAAPGWPVPRLRQRC